jgi:molecular chaperone HtpG
VVDNLIDKQETGETVLSKEETEKLKSLFEVDIPSLHVTVEVKGLNQEAMPVVATRPEFMRRMKDMAALNGSMGAFYANMPDEVTLTVNGNHPIYPTILGEADADKQKKLIHNLADLALLSQGLLKGVELTNFIQRSVKSESSKEKKAALFWSNRDRMVR